MRVCPVAFRQSRDVMISIPAVPTPKTFEVRRQEVKLSSTRLIKRANYWARESGRDRVDGWRQGNQLNEFRDEENSFRSTESLRRVGQNVEEEALPKRKRVFVKYIYLAVVVGICWTMEHHPLYFLPSERAHQAEVSSAPVLVKRSAQEREKALGKWKSHRLGGFLIVISGATKQVPVCANNPLFDVCASIVSYKMNGQLSEGWQSTQKFALISVSMCTFIVESLRQHLILLHLVLLGLNGSMKDFSLEDWEALGLQHDILEIETGCTCSLTSSLSITLKRSRHESTKERDDQMWCKKNSHWNEDGSFQPAATWSLYFPPK